MTFLSIVTRCHPNRPSMLAKNQESLTTQTDQDFEQVLIRDEVGIGVSAANALLADYDPAGEYVWVLDDDDMCIYDGMVSDIKEIVTEHDPDVVMVKMDHGGVIYPDAGWGVRPVGGRVGSSANIVKREVWNAHKDKWATGRYAADFDFIRDVFQNGYIVYWYDRVVSKVQRVSRGKPE
jgi:hypothetical protein